MRRIILLNTKRPFLLDFMQMSIGKVREEEPAKWLTLGLFWFHNKMCNIMTIDIGNFNFYSKKRCPMLDSAITCNNQAKSQHIHYPKVKILF